MNKLQQIEEFQNDIIDNLFNGGTYGLAEALYNAGYRKLPEDNVVLSREEYEKLESLYDCSQGAYMTSNIGDLPLTVEGLREAVDEITRLNIVEAELQELNIKYYNEAKDLRRQLADTEAENKRLSEKLGQILLSIDTVKEMNAMCNIDDHRKQAVKEFAEKLQKELPCRDYTFNGNTYSMILTLSMKYVIDELLKEYESGK